MWNMVHPKYKSKDKSRTSVKAAKEVQPRLFWPSQLSVALKCALDFCWEEKEFVNHSFYTAFPEWSSRNWREVRNYHLPGKNPASQLCSRLTEDSFQHSDGFFFFPYDITSMIFFTFTRSQALTQAVQDHRTLRIPRHSLLLCQPVDYMPAGHSLSSSSSCSDILTVTIGHHNLHLQQNHIVLQTQWVIWSRCSLTESLS